jgi:hypothetical protein
MPLRIVPIFRKAAVEWIERHHRHHLAPQGWLFGVSCYNGDRLCGVATVGRPVARKLQDGVTCEVTRCCTDGTKNACSILYAAARRAAFAMGYRRIITYILESEPGTSLVAAGWTDEGIHGGGEWNNNTRRRPAATNPGPKRRFSSNMKGR